MSKEIIILRRHKIFYFKLVILHKWHSDIYLYFEDESTKNIIFISSFYEIYLYASNTRDKK